MDWVEDTQTDIWAFPRAMVRTGGVGPRSIKWTSKYGSVVAGFYNVAVVDGMNEAGLSGNVLYLAEADYGDPEKTDKPLLSVGAWLQYVLDKYSTVAEAVEDLEKEPFRIVAPELPDGKAASGHLAISDVTGDSAIFEYVEGELVIHHGKEYTVMTNSPVFDQQLAVDRYWESVGGINMLPGTHRSSDRYARTKWNLDAMPNFTDKRMCISAVLSLLRSISVPLGISDPQKPNIASTTWRTLADLEGRIYYFCSAYSPSVIWVDMDNLRLAPGSRPAKLDLENHPVLLGEVSRHFRPAVPFRFLGSENSE
jgi:choloylglycine hydrolase